MTINYLKYEHGNNKLATKYQGFTLVELMIVIVIVAILAAIAVPSYRRYVIQNAEDEAKAQMQQIQLQLERWRGSVLSYKGFVPKNGVDNDGKPEYGYVSNDSKYGSVLGTGDRLIYIPIGSDENTHKYVIALVDGNQTKSNGNPITNVDEMNVLNNTTSTTDVEPSVGRSWKMMAIPNPDAVAKSGSRFMMTSTGIKCQSKDTSTNILSTDCGTGAETW